MKKEHMSPAAQKAIAAALGVDPKHAQEDETLQKINNELARRGIYLQARGRNFSVVRA